MGFRFRRSIRLGKGLRINLSKSGASLSVGRRGATVNFGPKGEKLTVGLPGTGLSYSKMLGRTHPSERRSQPPVEPEHPADTSPPPAGQPFKFRSLVPFLVFLAVLIGALIGLYAAGLTASHP